MRLLINCISIMYFDIFLDIGNGLDVAPSVPHAFRHFINKLFSTKSDPPYCIPISIIKLVDAVTSFGLVL